MKMVNRLFLVLSLLFSLIFTYAQPTFERTYQAPFPDLFDPTDVIQLPSEAYMIAYQRRDLLGGGVFREHMGIMRTNRNGVLQGITQYQLPDYSSTDYFLNARIGTKLVRRRDGQGFVLATNTEGVMSVDNVGNHLWSFNYTGGAIGRPRWMELEAAPDGSYIVMGHGFLNNAVGTPEQFPVVMKLSPNGQIIWSRKMVFAGSSTDIIPHQMIQDANGDIYVLGIAEPTKYVLWKLRLSGSTHWVRSFDISPITPVIRGMPNIVRAQNGQFLIAAGSTVHIAGDFNPFDRDEDLLTIKLTRQGNLLNARLDNLLNPGAGFLYDFHDFIEKPGGGFALIDWGNDFDAALEEATGCVINITALGRPLTAGRQRMPVYAATLTQDGDLGIVGADLNNLSLTHPPIQLTKSNDEGSTGCDDHKDPYRLIRQVRPIQRSEPFDIITSRPPREIIQVATTTPSWQDAYICFDGNNTPPPMPRTGAQPASTLPVLYPNPSTGEIIVDLRDNNAGQRNLDVLDIRGKVILSQKIEPGIALHKLRINQAGIFIIRLSNKDIVWTQKVSVVK